MIMSPIIMELSAASFRISVRDWGDPIITNCDFAVLACSCLDSNNLPTSFAPFLAYSCDSFLAISSWKIQLFSSTSPIFAEHIPRVIPSTAQPILSDDASAAAKLPWPMPFIIVAPSVSLSGVIMEIFVLLFG